MVEFRIRFILPAFLRSAGGERKDGMSRGVIHDLVSFLLTLPEHRGIFGCMDPVRNDRHAELAAVRLKNVCHIIPFPDILVVVEPEAEPALFRNRLLSGEAEKRKQNQRSWKKSFHGKNLSLVYD